LEIFRKALMSQSNSVPSSLEFKKLFAGPAPVSRNLIVDSAIGFRQACEKKESAGANNWVIDLYELQGTF